MSAPVQARVQGKHTGAATQLARTSKHEPGPHWAVLRAGSQSFLPQRAMYYLGSAPQAPLTYCQQQFRIGNDASILAGSLGSTPKDLKIIAVRNIPYSNYFRVAQNVLFFKNPSWYAA